MANDCEICRGSKVVRLPIYRSVSVSPTFDAPAMEETSRDYPCPECGGAVKQDRVAVLDAHTMVCSEISDTNFADHARRAAAHRLVDHLLEGGFIEFERGPIRDRDMAFPMVATLGVVSKGQVATLEQRIAERQDQVARAVAQKARSQIENWGSHHGNTSISKREAHDQIDSALNHVLSEWHRMRKFVVNG